MPRVTIYYFHRQIRCHSCLQIEEWAKQAVESKFSNLLSAGTIKWRTVNVEEKGNEHFVKEFKLDGPSLVMVSMNDGKGESWKNLEKVWDLLGYEQQFTTYVQDELSHTLESTSSTSKP